MEDGLWFSYKNTQYPSLRHELMTTERIKQEIDRRCSLSCLKSDCDWPYVSCMDHVAPIKPYVCVCEFSVFKKDCLVARSYSPISLVSSSTDSGAQSRIRGFTSVGEDKDIMISRYKVPCRSIRVGTNCLLTYVRVEI